MSWTPTTFTWPPCAASIETGAEATLAAVPGAQHAALASLAQAAGEVAFNRHPLSQQAEALLGLRAQLDQLLIDGHRLTVTPYDHDVGKVEQTGHYLAPQNAIHRLADKLRDNADPHRPTGTLYALGLLISAPSLGQFGQQLTAVTRLLPLPELAALARRVAAEQEHQAQKMRIPARAITPQWVPGRHNAAPLRPASVALGARLAQLESLAADRLDPVAKLAALAAKRAVWLEDQAQALAELKAGLSGGLLRMVASGSAAAIANALTGGVPAYETPHSAAVLLVSPHPLTFLQELLP